MIAIGVLLVDDDEVHGDEGGPVERGRETVGGGVVVESPLARLGEAEHDVGVAAGGDALPLPAERAVLVPQPALTGRQAVVLADRVVVGVDTEAGERAVASV